MHHDSTPSYPCYFKMHVAAYTNIGWGGDICVERTGTLPAIPHKGEYVSFESGGELYTVSEVYYIVDSPDIHIWFENDDSAAVEWNPRVGLSNDKRDENGMKRRAEELAAQGWTVIR